MTTNAPQYTLPFNPARRLVDQEGRLLPEFIDYLNKLQNQFNANVTTYNADITTAQSTGDTAQTTANNSAQSAGQFNAVPSGIVWNSDPTTGNWPAGNPTEDISIDFRDTDDSVLTGSTITLRGTLTTASGNIAVTEVGSSSSSVTFTLIDDGTGSVKADVMYTLGSGSKLRGTVSWNAQDVSTAGTTPVTGGGK